MAIIKPTFFGSIIPSGMQNFRVNTTARAMSQIEYLTPATVASQIQSLVASVSGFSGSLAWVDDTGRLNIACPNSWTLQNGTTFNALPWLGFPTWPVASTNDAAKYGGGTPHGVTGVLPLLTWWRPEVPAKDDSLPQTERPDSTVTRTMGGATLRIEDGVLYTKRTWQFAFLPMRKVYTEAAALNNDRAIQYILENSRRFRFFPDETNLAVFEDYVVTQDAMQKFAPTRQFTNTALYRVTFNGWRV